MDNEKMMILKMVEAGKISAEEASKLLSSVGTEFDKKPKSKIYNSNDKSTAYNSQNSFREIRDEFSKKLESFTKNMEPKLQKLGEVISETTTNVADMISKSFETTKNEVKGKVKPSNSTKFEYIVSSPNNELKICALNGDVTIKGYNGDKISGTIYYNLKNNFDDIKFLNLGQKYFLDYNEENFSNVFIDIFLPEKLFNSVYVETINGTILLETFKCEELYINNSNANTILNSVEIENLFKTDINNGKLLLQNVTAESAILENCNASLDAYNIDISKMKLSTFNEEVSINNNGFYKYNDYIWAIETSNERIKVNLPNSENVGYYLKAHTSLNNVKVGLTKLIFSTNTENDVEAKSIDFDKSAKKVKISLETSNAPLVIN